MATHSIDVLDGQSENVFDICIDGYVHKRHRNMTDEAVEQCLKSLRTYYQNIGERYRITRPVIVV